MKAIKTQAFLKKTSLENFGQFDHYAPKDEFEQRHVDIVPLYALSNLELQDAKNRISES